MKKYFAYDYKIGTGLWAWLVIVGLVLACVINYYAVAYSNAYNLKHAFSVGVIWSEGFNKMLVLWVIAALFVILLSAMLIKPMIAAISFDGKPFATHFDGKKYFVTVFKGYLMSIVTFGINLPWLVKDLVTYYTKNPEYKGQRFDFFGMGRILFGVYLVCVIIPFILYGIAENELYTENGLEPTQKFEMAAGSIMAVLAFISAYLIYKWRVDFKYNFYQIRMKTKFLNASLIFIPMMLLASFPLTLPISILVLYKYIANNTSATYDNKVKQFGYDDGNFVSDYLFVLTHTLITCITLGLYFPFAWRAVGKRLVGRTYIQA
ncbi:MAG: DUF898 family protein [Bacteroidetes bacterium]|nr:DUF898 family protein [Bacteroidota bacterium]